MNFIKGKLLPICAIILIFIGVGLAIYLYELHKLSADKILIKGDSEHEVIEVVDLKLIPSESKKYTIDLIVLESSDFSGSLKFVEDVDGGLKQFVDVCLEIEDEVLFEGKLGELLSDSVIEFATHIDSLNPVKIHITYSMDESVGNEAENVYADFSIDVKLERNAGEE